MPLVLRDFYGCNSAVARTLWETLAPCKVVSRELGFPVIVCNDDDDRAPLRPNLEDFDEEVFRCAQETLWSAKLDLWRKGEVRLVNKHSEIDGIGVFLSKDCSRIEPGELLGVYGGTFYVSEVWDDVSIAKPLLFPEDFLYNLNDGANGIVLDGRTGPSELKFLNHSCEPNVRMVEAFLEGHWCVLVETVTEIEPGNEILADFELHTEDPEEAALPCKCRAKNCRATLFQFHEF